MAKKTRKFDRREAQPHRAGAAQDAEPALYGVHRMIQPSSEATVRFAARSASPHGLIVALGLALLLASSLVAAAQRETRGEREPAQQTQELKFDGQRMSEIRIAVQDVNTREDVVILRDGDVLELNVGEKVRLRLIAIPASQNHSQRYPAGRFTGPERSNAEVVLSDPKPHLGSVVLEARRLGDGDSFFRYQVTDNVNMDRRLFKGTFGVRIRRGGADPGGGGYDSGEQGYASKVVDALYRGILMRSPDAGARPRVEDIANNGHAAAVNHARDIAKSRESTIDIYGRGVTHEERLLSLYEHLMGLSEREISEVAWRNDLQRLRNGQLEIVVINMCQSREFADRFGRGPRPQYR